MKIQNKKVQKDYLVKDNKMKKKKISKSQSQTIQNENQKITYNNKEDVIINNPLLEKYFALQCLDVYEKNFKKCY